MSNQPAPNKPVGPRMNHLQMEPISMSFASPQQLAHLAAGTGSTLPRLPLNTTNQPPMAMMHAGHNTNIRPHMHVPTYQIHTTPSAPTNEVTTAAATSATTKPQSASSDQNILSPLPAQPINLETFKGFKFVTLDGLQVETREIYDEISGTFKWEMCESQEDICLNFVRDQCQNRRVFLVSSGSLGSKIVPQIHDLPQLYAIYIYCADVKRHEEWANKFAKVRVVCDNDDRDLLPQFAVDVAQANIDWGDALLKQGAHDKAREKFQLALDKLTKHAPNHAHAMNVEIKNKLKECK